MDVGRIDLRLEGASVQETERFRTIIHTLLESGALNTRNGRVILHFDHLGVLQMVERDFICWRRPKAPSS